MSDQRIPARKRQMPSSERKRESGGEQPSRRVRFPGDRSMGTLWIRDRDSSPDNYAFWEPLGEARGVVSVPGEKELRLVINPQAATDLSPLSQLHPDDLQYLQLSGTRVTNAGLSHLGKLTGLKVLWLYDTPISDIGLVHLRGLTGLRVLNLRSTMVSASGVDALQAALPQCEFRRAWK